MTSPYQNQDLQYALARLRNYQVIHKDDNYTWFMPSTYNIYSTSHLRIIKELKKISNNELTCIWNHIYSIPKLKQFIDEKPYFYVPFDAENDEEDAKTEKEDNEQKAYCILNKAFHCINSKPGKVVTADQRNYMLEYLNPRKHLTHDFNESFELHINALKHPRYYKSLIQDPICDSKLKGDYGVIPIYLEQAMELGKRIYHVAVERARKKQENVPVLNNNSSDTTVHTDSSIPTSEKVEPSVPSVTQEVTTAVRSPKASVAGESQVDVVGVAHPPVESILKSDKMSHILNNNSSDATLQTATGLTPTSKKVKPTLPSMTPVESISKSDKMSHILNNNSSDATVHTDSSISTSEKAMPTLPSVTQELKNIGMSPKSSTVDDSDTGVNVPATVHVASTAENASNVLHSNQVETTPTHAKIIPIDYSKFVHYGYHDHYTIQQVFRYFGETIYRMNQHFAFHEPSGKIIVTYNTTHNKPAYYIKSIPEFKEMCSGCHVSIKKKCYPNHRHKPTTTISIATIWLNEMGRLVDLSRWCKYHKIRQQDIPKDKFGKCYTKKIIHDDISKYQTHNDSIFYPIYHPGEMNIMDKWIVSWLKDQRFCQIPNRQAPFADGVYHDFLEFSQRDKREYRKQEFFGDFYLRFACCKPVSKRLRRRKGNSVLDIPTHEQCMESFTYYVKKYLHKRLM